MLHQLVSQIKVAFGREAWQRRVEQQHTASLTTAQRFVQRELRALFAQISDDDLKAQINVLDAAFRRPLTKTLNSELNAIKRADIRGPQLAQELIHLYTRYALDQQRTQSNQAEHEDLPVIVCSKRLI